MNVNPLLGYVLLPAALHLTDDTVETARNFQSQTQWPTRAVFVSF